MAAKKWLRRIISAAILSLSDMAMTGRDAALKALIACRKSGAWSDGALKELLQGLDRREAALASRLCYGVLQNRLLLDFWIGSFAKGKLQPNVRDILRLAVYQLRFMDKIPPSAAVNEAVEQTKKQANAAAARLVNGVLRNILRTSQLPMPEDLATKYSHPQALTELLVKELGPETAERLLQSHNEAPETVLQINSLLTDLDRTIASLEESGVRVQRHPWLKNCVTVSGTGNLEQLAGYEQGWFYAQDAAAKLAVLSAGIKPGMRVLDCCAAPGGKSFAAAMEMGNRGELFSCDIHPHKIKLIEKGAQRLGIRILSAYLQDASQSVEEWKGTMDVVLADVPCSGLGVIRKKPDIRYKELNQTEALPPLQQAILSCQAEYVKPGGVLLYSTCTILQRENETVARRFLEEHPEFSAEVMEFPQNSGLENRAMTTLLPCDHGTDGFFICKLRRKP